MSTGYHYSQHIDPLDRDDVFRVTLKYLKELDNLRELNNDLRAQLETIKRRHNILLGHCIQAHGMQIAQE
ncbi:hypothetical protein C8R43DRAFT_1130227 [Mycena crocata]|nr:hypothetical protein C8R43DRAFT_1130227 [Mycena crocata]